MLFFGHGGGRLPQRNSNRPMCVVEAAKRLVSQPTQRKAWSRLLHLGWCSPSSCTRSSLCSNQKTRTLRRFVCQTGSTAATTRPSTGVRTPRTEMDPPSCIADSVEIGDSERNVKSSTDRPVSGQLSVKLSALSEEDQLPIALPTRKPA